MSSLYRDIGAYLTEAVAIESTAQTAGAETEADGASIDRETYGISRLSGRVIIVSTTTMADTGDTLTYDVTIQDSTTGVAWTDYKDTFAAVTAHTAAAPLTTDPAVVSFDVDLSSAERYVRVQATPNFSSTSNDTVLFSAVMVLGPAREI